MQKLSDAVGVEKVPVGLTDDDLGWLGNCGSGQANHFERDRPDAQSPQRRQSSGSRYVFQQMFNFRYQDGARMLTTGGLLYDEGMQGAVDKCRFQDLPFFRSGEAPFEVEVPLLTFREMRHLDAQLPTHYYRSLKSAAIPERDVRTYADVYRYFPAFTEVNL